MEADYQKFHARQEKVALYYNQNLDSISPYGDQLGNSVFSKRTPQQEITSIAEL
jgi:hypothetical protein